MPERLTDARIEELLTMEAKAPEETWAYQEKSDDYTHIVRLPNNEYICGFGQNSDGKAESRARLSIASRNSIRSLLKEVKLLRLQEREKPVKISRVGFCASLDCKRGLCTCGDFVNDFQNYCPNCGRRLGWQ